jgi:leucyl/phenylalanyl-tRNA--protein transferase
MIDAYSELHALGFAHSVEVWRDGQLVGGLYGISLGGMFCGESMFSTESNTSKLALWHLIQRCQEWGMEWVDGQVENPHLVSLGAELISREAYLNHLEKALQQDTHRGKW